jgi:hypothetical protein
VSTNSPVSFGSVHTCGCEQVTRSSVKALVKYDTVAKVLDASHVPTHAQESRWKNHTVDIHSCIPS